MLCVYTQLYAEIHTIYTIDTGCNVVVVVFVVVVAVVAAVVGSGSGTGRGSGR